MPSVPPAWGVPSTRGRFAEPEAGFDFAVSSYGVRRAWGLPSAPPAGGVPSTRGSGAKRRYSLGDPSDGLHGATKQDVQTAISDMLSGYALDPVTCAGSDSHFICVAIDRRSPRGVRILEGGDMPCIPEDQRLVWCARGSLRSEKDCWIESMKIVHLLAPREMMASGLDCPRQRRGLSGTPLLFHAKEMLLQRGAAGITKKRVVKRVVPVGLVGDDVWMDGPQSLSGMPHGPRAHWRGCRARKATA